MNPTHECKQQTKNSLEHVALPSRVQSDYELAQAIRAWIAFNLSEV